MLILGGFLEHLSWTFSEYWSISTRYDQNLWFCVHIYITGGYFVILTIIRSPGCLYHFQSNISFLSFCLEKLNNLTNSCAFAFIFMDFPSLSTFLFLLSQKFFFILPGIVELPSYSVITLSIQFFVECNH